MQKAHQLKSSHRNASTCRVHLEFVDPEACAVFVTGSFNHWRSKGAPMTHLGNGRWAKELLLAPGRYEYRFVVNGYKVQADCDDRAGRYHYRVLDENGRWANDPSAPEVVRDPRGGFKAVLLVPPAHTFEAEISI
jgi:1,4-alpha-glucan branching enzyme